MNAYKSLARTSVEEQIDHRSEVLDTLRGNADAVALAKVYAVARQAAGQSRWPLKGTALESFVACSTAYQVVGDVLEDYVFDACRLHGLDRSDLGKLSEIVAQIIGEV